MSTSNITSYQTNEYFFSDNEEISDSTKITMNYIPIMTFGTLHRTNKTHYKNNENGFGAKAYSIILTHKLSKLYP